ncbi:MAG: hypothetical protein K6G26_11435 [Lachnospiraceae bacterium]|nr:hypothetical protein [Lachnospiraceae bacterium]
MRKNNVLCAAMFLSVILVGCGEKQQEKTVNITNEPASDTNIPVVKEVSEEELSNVAEKEELIGEEKAISIAQEIWEGYEGEVENYDSPDVKLENITKREAEILSNAELEGKMAYVVVFSLKNKTIETDRSYIDAYTGELFGGLPVD